MKATEFTEIASGIVRALGRKGSGVDFHFGVALARFCSSISVVH